ncbi:hypothetical protein ASD64_09140 [Mesorhizobium sp. Root157]|uniref:hypothetical protein n=1 Tax=Mesorhizobium sp. Root157 TaxID=1736477 RepID=UPI0006FFBD18|nr:hypothetical protein [Mesorhizobium sp. Root157]KQZ81908.1 hypothetical protein ASD64_09140 [Mesorhizobium sp. Root157]
MRRSQQSWATRKLPPVTVDEIERHLDLVAMLMDKAGRKAHLFLPIWQWLEEELQKQKDADAMMAAARARLIRSQDRTATQSA